MAELRQAHLDEQRDAIGSAVDDYFLYDEVLETALMLGIAPAEVGDPETDAFGVLTALARGTPRARGVGDDEVVRHELPLRRPRDRRTPSSALRPLPWREPTGEADVTWPVLGPYSLVKLSKLADGLDPVEHRALRRRRALDLGPRSSRSGFRLQLDEPSLGMVMTDDDRRIRDAAYESAPDLGDAADRDDPVRAGIGRDARGARPERASPSRSTSTRCRR